MQLFCDPTLLKTITITKKFSYYRIRPQIVSDKYPSNPPSSFLATPSIDVRSPALNQNEFLKSNYFYNTPNAFASIISHYEIHKKFMYHVLVMVDLNRNKSQSSFSYNKIIFQHLLHFLSNVYTKTENDM